MCVCVCVYIYIYIYVCVYMCVCVCVCIYMYIYIYINLVILCPLQECTFQDCMPTVNVFLMSTLEVFLPSYGYSIHHVFLFTFGPSSPQEWSAVQGRCSSWCVGSELSFSTRSRQASYCWVCYTQGKSSQTDTWPLAPSRVAAQCR